MRKRGWWGLALWLLGLGIGVQSAEATLLVYRSLDQQIQEAARIVRGRVLSKTSFIYKGNGHIYTDIKLQVTETLKGSAPTELTVRQLGGTIGERTTLIAGAARFTAGEEVVVFLAPEKQAGFLFIQDFGAGKFTVFFHEGRTLLRREVEGLAFYRHTSNPVDRIQTPIMSERPLDLDALRVRVRSFLERPKPMGLSTPTQVLPNRLQPTITAPTLPAQRRVLPTFRSIRAPIRAVSDRSTWKPAPLGALQKQRLPSFVKPLQGTIVQQRLQRLAAPQSTVKPSVQTSKQGGSR